MVNLTIDGKQVSVPEGTTVLKAAKSAGIDIPTLCDHPNLTPYGGCRLCVVEIEGGRTLQTSCTLPVMENMVVHTNTDKVREARRFILTMIFSDRNHFCPYCVVNDGDCELQQAAYHEEMTHWPIQPNWKPYEVDASHPYIVQDHNRCILCRRCVRVCSENVGNFTLGVEERGANSLIMADLGTPLGESSCISCGMCVQVCPTGSLIDRWSAYRGQVKDMEATESICIGCSIGCGVTALTKDNHLVRIEGNWEAAPNGGLVCKVGRFYPMEDQKERVQTPLVRKNGKLAPVSWEEAIVTITQQISENGKELLGLVSTRLPLEAISCAREIFAKNLQAKLTTLEEGKFTSLAYSISEKAGKPLESRLEDIEKADVILLLDADLVNDHEVASFLVKRNVALGTKLISVSSSGNTLDHIAACELQYQAKSTLQDVLDGLTAALISQGLNRTASSINASRALEHAEVVTGITTSQFLEAARMIGNGERVLLILGDEPQVANQEQLAGTILEFANTSASMREDWSGLLSLKGKANSFAAAQYGLDQPIEYNGEAVYIALGDDEPSQKLVQTLENAPFIAVQAAYTSQLTAMANVVLPTTIWGEETGHYMNVNGDIGQAVQFRTPVSAVKSNAEILKQLAVVLKVDERCGQDWEAPLKSRQAPAKIAE